MKNKSLLSFGFILLSSMILVQSCSEEKAAVPPPPTVSLSYSESFDSIQTVIDRGWRSINRSNPPGGFGWTQGSYIADNVKNGPWFSGIKARSAKHSANEYALVWYQTGLGLSYINTWLLTPPLRAKNGDSFSFWTTTSAPVSFPDRMQVWVNPNSASTNVGSNENETGDFTIKVLDINPNLTASGYPTTWTKYTVVLSGLPQGNTPKDIRIGFRYYVQGGGPSGANSNEIGIDDFEFISN